MKTKRTSQYANELGLPRPDSARFEHSGGSTSNTKGEPVFTVFEKLVAAFLYRMRISRVRACTCIHYVHPRTHAFVMLPTYW